MPASLVETGIIFYPLIPQMEKLKPYALQLNIHPLKAVGFNF